MATLLAVAPAHAQQVCLQLESQLAALERQNPQAVYQGILAEYEQARAAYDQVYRQADLMGCLPRVFRQLPASCNAIRTQLDRALARLNAAQEQLRAANPSNYTAQRNSLLQSLAANNCGPQYQQFANQGGNQNVRIGNGALLGRIIGVPIDGPPVEDFQPMVTTYRTLCVRACDGYYFPISFATTQSQFGADERTCQAQCPGAALYYHRNPGAPVEQATSISGAAYTSLENAFAFRESYNPECGCQSAAMEAARASAAEPVTEDVVIDLVAAAPGIPFPVPRPNPAEDPETMANRLGGLAPGPLNLAVSLSSEPYLVADDGTRLIGPAYYYAR